MDLINDNLFLSKNESIDYSGKITVDFVKNGKAYSSKTFNSGTNHLFTYLCNCLAGAIDSSRSASIDQRPGGILLYDNTNQLLSYNIIASDVEVTDEIPDSNSGATITYNFLIPSVAIIGKQISKVKLTSISKVSNSFLVFAEGSFGDPISTNDINTSIYIHWSLTLSNKGG